RNVNATVLGQSQYTGVAVELGLLRRREALLLLDGLLHLLRAHGLLDAEALSLNGIGRHTIRHEISLGAFHAAFRKLLVVFRTAARIGMALQDQVSVRLEGQILLEVAGEGEQCGLLASKQ